MSRVLVIDDDETETELLQAFLDGEVDQVESINDSRRVEEVFAEFQPDIVVLDLHMPGDDGLEVLRRLRSARESLGFLPVIMLTGDESDVARNAALILGADEFLTKPIDRSELVLRVRNLLHTRRLYVEAREGRSPES